MIWKFEYALQTKGTFLDSGAADGEHLSNTLGLEKVNGWRGLLVEASSVLFPGLKNKRRKAWLAPVCVSPTGSWEYVSQC